MTMNAIAPTLPSNLRRQSSKVVFTGSCLTVNKATFEDGDPQPFTLEPRPNVEVIVYNQKGTLLVRRVDDAGWDVVPAGTIALVTHSGQLDGLVSRGQHTAYWFSWYKDCAGLLSRWMEEQRALRPHGPGLSLIPADESTSVTIRELTQCAVGQSPIVEPKLLGSLQVLAVTAYQAKETFALAQKPHGMSEGLRTLVEAVIADPTREWSLKLASQVAGYSQFHLSRTFRAEMGVGLPEFVERCRIETALHRLNSGTKDLNEIALVSGFATASAFREALKKVVGVLPSELRRMAHH